jgi:hypothetical protein
MELVPTHYVDLVLGDLWRDRGDFFELAHSGVRIGSRVEVDISTAPEDVREAVLSYLDSNRTLGRDLAAGAPIGPWIVTERNLLSVTQQAGSKSVARGDLAREYEALKQVSETQGVIESLCGSSIDESIFCVPEVSVVEQVGTRTVVRVRVEGARAWPQCLGGAPSANEVERLFTLHTNHAAWRDRQVRRLSRVDVACVELLADPAPQRALVSTTA